MIIFAADIHLTPRAWTNRWSIEGDAFYALQQIQDYVKGKKCSGIVLGGDNRQQHTGCSNTVPPV